VLLPSLNFCLPASPSTPRLCPRDSRAPADYSATYERVRREALTEAFFGPPDRGVYSPAVQTTLHDDVQGRHRQVRPWGSPLSPCRWHCHCHCDWQLPGSATGSGMLRCTTSCTHSAYTSCTDPAQHTPDTPLHNPGRNPVCARPCAEYLRWRMSTWTCRNLHFIPGGCQPLALKVSPWRALGTLGPWGAGTGWDVALLQAPLRLLSLCPPLPIPRVVVDCSLAQAPQGGDAAAAEADSWYTLLAVPCTSRTILLLHSDFC